MVAIGVLVEGMRPLACRIVGDDRQGPTFDEQALQPVAVVSGVAGQAAAGWDSADGRALLRAQWGVRENRRSRGFSLSDRHASDQSPAGARRTDDRRVISGIVHILKVGCRWQDCPALPPNPGDRRRPRSRSRCRPRTCSCAPAAVSSFGAASTIASPARTAFSASCSCASARRRAVSLGCRAVDGLDVARLHPRQGIALHIGSALGPAANHPCPQGRFSWRPQRHDPSGRWTSIACSLSPRYRSNVTRSSPFRDMLLGLR